MQIIQHFNSVVNPLIYEDTILARVAGIVEPHVTKLKSKVLGCGTNIINKLNSKIGPQIASIKSKLLGNASIKSMTSRIRLCISTIRSALGRIKRTDQSPSLEENKDGTQNIALEAAPTDNTSNVIDADGERPSSSNCAVTGM